MQREADGMWPEVERREEPRVEVAVPVEIERDTASRGMSRDLSTEGMRIELDDRLPVGAEVSVTFQLPDEEAPVSADGQIRWHKQVGPKSAGRWIVGVHLSSVEEGRGALETFLEEARNADR